MESLSTKEKQVRRILIEVAKGNRTTHFPGLISYKELWEQIADTPWGRGNRSKIVNLITRISGFELSEGRPPLNELVVVKNKRVPGEEWKSIRTYLNREYGVNATYKTHEQAQEACWEYWGKKDAKELNESEAEEGVLQDKKSKFRTRNQEIVASRKKLDKYTCQACDYKMKVNGKYIIDCHHRYPLGMESNIRVTRIQDLVCLCPNCHRIAHSRKFPLSVSEIKEVLGDV